MKSRTGFCHTCKIIAICLTSIFLLLPPVLFLANHKFWAKFYESLQGEAEVNGFTIPKLIEKFFQFFVYDPDDPVIHEQLWQADRHMCVRPTSYFVHKPELHCLNLHKPLQYYFGQPNVSPFFGFLTIAPAKVEVLSIKPLLVIFKEMVSPDMSFRLMRTARRWLANATAFNPLTGEQQRSAYRHSQHGFFCPCAYDDVALVYEYIETVTGLSTETADSMQIAKYEAGGHYSPHYDFYDPHLAFLRSEYWLMERGNNVATLLLYLTKSPPNAGTIFPRLNLTINADAGDAIFWYNVRPDGKLNRWTLHAGCRVPPGSYPRKWIANVWLRERGQEFRRPCFLKQEDHE